MDDLSGGIRRAHEAEVDAVTDLYRRARRAAVPAIPPMVHTDDEVRSWMRDIVFPLHDVRVADIGGHLLAMMVLYPGWVDQLYVEPELTGHGIGAAMVDEAKHLHPDGLDVWVFAGNEGARRFYRRHGFDEVEHPDGEGNEEGAPDVRYRWRRPASPL